MSGPVMEPDQPDFQNSTLAFWLSERVYKTHSVIYGTAVVAWAVAVAFIPGEWSLFWPIMIWTIVYMIHFLVFKGTHVDEEWVDERVERINDEAKDLSHIEAIRDDYTSVDRLRRGPPTADDRERR